MSSALQWVASGGGPLILISESHLNEWEGSDTPSVGRIAEAVSRNGVDLNGPATDYDRACDVASPLGLIAVGSGQALVLGNDPNQTAWFPTGPAAGTLARWVYGEDDSEDVIVPIIVSAPDDIFHDEPFTFVVDGPLYLFDSAYSGADAASGQVFDGVLVIKLPPGVYQVESAQHKPDPETWFDLHRLSLREA